MNYEGVCRTAPATPGLLKSVPKLWIGWNTTRHRSWNFSQSSFNFHSKRVCYQSPPNPSKLKERRNMYVESLLNVLIFYLMRFCLHIFGLPLVLKRPLMAHWCTQSIWNWGRGTWPEIKIYGPPTGRPCTVWFFQPSCRVALYSLVFQTVLPTAASSGRRIDRPRPACQLDKAARQDTLKNQTVQGHPAGRLEKSNCTRPPRGRTVYFDFRPRPPPSVPYSIVYTSEPLMPNSEPWKLAFIKRVCSCAIPRAEHYEQQMLLTGAWAEHLEI